MAFKSVFKIFQIHVTKKIDFYFIGQQGPWSGSYAGSNELIITFFCKPDFSGFFICVINGSGVSFGQVANSLEFIPHHMTALPVYICLDFQASYNFGHQKISTCVSF